MEKWISALRRRKAAHLGPAPAGLRTSGGGRGGAAAFPQKSGKAVDNPVHTVDNCSNKAGGRASPPQSGAVCPNPQRPAQIRSSARMSASAAFACRTHRR